MMIAHLWTIVYADNGQAVEDLAPPLHLNVNPNGWHGAVQR